MALILYLCLYLDLSLFRSTSVTKYGFYCFIPIYYSCGLSTATIKYSCPSVCLFVCVSVCVHDNSKNNASIHLKLEHIVVYENSSDEFDIGHCAIKSRSRRDFEIFLHLPQYKLSRPISQLWHMLGSCD